MPRIALERHRQETGRLVDDDEAVVFVDDVQVADDADAGTGFRAAGTVDPEADVVSLGQRPGRVAHQRFLAVDVDLAAFQRGRRLAAGAEPVRGGQELVEARARVTRAYRPLSHRIAG